MSQILLFHQAYERIADALRERFDPPIDPVLWDLDGTLIHRGKTVVPVDVQPVAAWFSADLLGGSSLSAIAATVAELPSIRWVQSANAGLDAPAYKALFQRGIRFSKSGAQSIPIAEYVLTYALEHAQDLALRRAAQAGRHWQPHRFSELWHSTWLIVGYGHIGRNVAKRAKAFDAHTVIVRPSLGGDEYADTVIPPEKLYDHLPSADVIVLACPATEATRGLVNQVFLSHVQDSALLINVARGALIDDAALLASLDQGRPARAVLDVFAVEPLPTDHAFWIHPKVTVTAHISNAGSGTRPRGDELFLSNLQRFLAGQPPTDLVN